MLFSNLLTKYILVPFWTRLFIFYSFYFFVRQLHFFDFDNSLAECMQRSSDVFQSGKSFIPTETKSEINEPVVLSPSEELYQLRIRDFELKEQIQELRDQRTISLCQEIPSSMVEHGWWNPKEINDRCVKSISSLVAEVRTNLNRISELETQINMQIAEKKYNIIQKEVVQIQKELQQTQIENLRLQNQLTVQQIAETKTNHEKNFMFRHLVENVQQESQKSIQQNKTLLAEHTTNVEHALNESLKEKKRLIENVQLFVQKNLELTNRILLNTETVVEKVNLNQLQHTQRLVETNTSAMEHLHSNITTHFQTLSTAIENKKSFVEIRQILTKQEKTILDSVSSLQQNNVETIAQLSSFAEGQKEILSQVRNIKDNVKDIRTVTVPGAVELFPQELYQELSNRISTVDFNAELTVEAPTQSQTVSEVSSTKFKSAILAAEAKPVNKIAEMRKKFEKSLR